MRVFVVVVLNVRMSWAKFRGGVEAEWIGYLRDLGRFELGISLSRAAWAPRWLTEKVTEGMVNLVKGLGGSSLLLVP